MAKRVSFLFAATCLASLYASTGQSQEAGADAWAARTLAQLKTDEKLALLQGYLTARVPEKERPDIPSSAGYVPGVPRLGIPMLVESDASLGIANMGGFMRRGDEATALPSGLAMGSSWNPAQVEASGAIMGTETRAKGFNVLLAGGINLAREPRNGRNFEYFSEDPLLSGVMGGHSIKGIQSKQVISTAKHYLLNAQETGRSFADVRMGEAAMRESDLLAFQIALEVGDPGSIMCSYNKVNGEHACENRFLLNHVLRDDWKFKGWVMSDWGAVHSVSIGAGLDQESGTQPKGTSYFGAGLRDALNNGRVSQFEIDRAVLRILRTMKAKGLVGAAPARSTTIDFDTHLAVAQSVAEQGIVLLKNEGNLLPLTSTAKRIVVIGAHADKGVPQGGGSSQVWPVGGAALSLSIPGDAFYHKRLYMPSPPLAALQANLPRATITFDDGTDPVRAAAAAASADIAIVFAEQFTAEAHDVLSLALPADQDAMISAVAAANPRTVVVLETGGPVAMPWLDKVPAVIEAWYSGNRGGLAIANVLSGKVNPSGRLPVTFPASLAQAPNPTLPGSGSIKLKPNSDLYDLPEDSGGLTIEYPEGSDVGYRWYARKGYQPLFPFGYGLSYTRFQTSRAAITGLTAKVEIRNTGTRAGADVAQLYLVSRNGKPLRRLVGFQRVELGTGQRRAVSLDIDPRLLADWSGTGWTMPAGTYVFAAGRHADDVALTTKVRFAAKAWRD